MSEFIKEGQYHNLAYDDEMQKIVNQHKDYESLIKMGNSAMYEVVTTLLKLNPTWRFVISRGYPMGAYMRVSGVDVLIDGEEVGCIQDTYVRGSYGVSLSGHKMDNQMRTSNVKRALSICKKEFVKRNTAERVRQAEDDAKRLITSVTYSHHSAMRQYANEVDKMAIEYALNKAREDFVKHLLAPQLQTLHKYEEQAAHMVTIETVKAAFEGKKTILLIRDGDRYIAKLGDDVALYDPAQLKDGIKGKIGMLKLCEDGQMVDNVGCRVNEEVFVILVDEEGANDA